MTITIQIFAAKCPVSNAEWWHCLIFTFAFLFLKSSLFGQPLSPSVIVYDADSIGTTSATLHGAVNSGGLSTIVKFQYGKTESYGSEAVARQSPIKDSSFVPVSATIANLTPMTTYFYRLVASNSSNPLPSTSRTFVTLLPTSLDLNTRINFPNRSSAKNYQPSDYRLIGLPGASNRPVNELLSGKQGKEWQVYWDNGESSSDPNQIFVKFDAEAPFLFSVGRAYWIIHKGPLNISAEVPFPPLDGDHAEIPLRISGWNLITNPFSAAIPWAIIKIENGLGGGANIYFWDGSLRGTTSFEPFVGYYFFNDSRTSLKVPLTFSTSSSNSEEAGPISWRIHIALTSGKFADLTASLGVSPQASAGLDEWDSRKPRAFAFTPTVAFHRPNWDASYSTFATDIRSEVDSLESWDFEVRTITHEATQLTFSGVGKIPPHLEVYLLDESRVHKINLRVDSLYQFTPAAELSKFSLVVGNTTAVHEKLSVVRLPTAFTLGKNYPNPFNPATTIPVAVPVQSHVKLQVYNLLGEVVKTIYDDVIAPGRYWFTWDGRDENGRVRASGVYFYRLTVDRQRALAGKMIFIQ